MAAQEMNYRTEQCLTFRKHTYVSLRGKERWGDA